VLGGLDPPTQPPIEGTHPPPTITAAVAITESPLPHRHAAMKEVPRTMEER